MQDEAAAAVDRAAIADHEISRGRRQADGFLFVDDAQLHQEIGKAHLLNLVDDQPHRAFLAVGADIDDGACEAVVLHAGHGDEELVIEEPARGGIFVPQKIHGRNVASFWVS